MNEMYDDGIVRIWAIDMATDIAYNQHTTAQTPQKMTIKGNKY